MTEGGSFRGAAGASRSCRGHPHQVGERAGLIFRITCPGAPSP